MLTAIDQVANRNHLQLIKAAIPYLPPENQPMISVCVKMLEVQNVAAFYNHSPDRVSACGSDSERPGIVDILSDIRNYCEGEEQEMIDRCLQLLSTLELYSTLMQSMEEGPEPEMG